MHKLRINILLMFTKILCSIAQDELLCEISCWKAPSELSISVFTEVFEMTCSDKTHTFLAPTLTTWCDCGGRSPVANEVRYIGLMDNSREENDHDILCRIRRVSQRDFDLCY